MKLEKYWDPNKRNNLHWATTWSAACTRPNTSTSLHDSLSWFTLHTFYTTFTKCQNFHPCLSSCLCQSSICYILSSSFVLPSVWIFHTTNERSIIFIIVDIESWLSPFQTIVVWKACHPLVPSATTFPKLFWILHTLQLNWIHNHWEAGLVIGNKCLASQAQSVFWSSKFCELAENLFLKRLFLRFSVARFRNCFKKILPDFYITLQDVAHNIEGCSDFYYFNSSFIAILG